MRDAAEIIKQVKYPIKIATVTSIDTINKFELGLFQL